MIAGIVAAQSAIPATPPQLPEVRGAGYFASSGAAATLALTYSAQDGDLIIIDFCSRSASATAPTLSTGGWTLLGGAGIQNGTSVVDFLWYKAVSGSESGVTITPPASINCAASVLVIKTGTHQGVVEGASVTASGQPNPPSLTPTWGAANTLWASTYARATGATVSVYPLPDNNSFARSGGLSGSASGGICTQSLNASSLDPSSWTLSVSGTHICRTFAVRPA